MDASGLPIQRVPNAPTSALWTPEGEPGAPLVVPCARCGEDMVLPAPERGLTIPKGVALTHDVCPRDRVVGRYVVRLAVVQQAEIVLGVLGLTATFYVDAEELAGFQVTVEASSLQDAIAASGQELSEKWNRLHEAARLADQSPPA